MCKKSVFWISMILVLCLGSGARAGLIGHWKLDEGSGTTVRDSSGGNNHGRFISAPLWVDGVFGKALHFDGVDDYVEVPHNARLIPTTGKVTVSVWINAERHTGPGGSQWQGILAKGSWDPRLYNLYTEASQVLHFSTGPGSATIGTLSTGQVPLNEWVHVVAIVDGRHLYYINGESAGEAGQGATVPQAGTAALTIGQTGESNFFLGMIDDVRLYDRALTAAQVRGLFEGVPPVFGKAEKPSPPDKAIGVTMALLQWTAGENALFHNVYLGTSPELTQADLVGQRLPYLMYFHVAGLTAGATYYWRVDEIQADGTTTTGDVWSFTAAPVKAYIPNPPDGARYITLDTELSWSAGSTAVSHDVYFGTNRDEVAAGTGNTFKGNRSTTSFDPGTLLGDTVYYWRIDEVLVAGKEVGDVWSFRTLPEIPIADPNLVGWWKLDEVGGTTVVDWSGYGNHGTLRGAPERVPGYDGRALKLNGINQYAEIPHDETLTVDSEVTVMAWINAERYTGPGGQEWQGIIAKGNSPRSYSFYTYAPGTLHFSTAGGGGVSTGIVPLNEWVHVAVAGGPTGHAYFINGEPAGTGGAIGPPGAQDTATVLIGNTQEDAREFLGMIDDARIYNVALTQEQIQEAMRGDPLLAWDPQPPDGSTVDVGQAASLTWQPGDTAAQHDVYFGNDATAVTDAEIGSPEYLGRQPGASYSSAGLVEFGGGDYFWRIDEVEADGATVHKGRTWTFTVADYLIVDDFESYTDELTGRIFQTWLDGWGYTEPEVVEGNGTGATVGYLDPPFAERTIVHSGRQSMPFDYNNIVSPYYSEAERTWASPQNWTLHGVDTLSLRVRGNPIRFSETSPGQYVMSSTSGDIWGSADHFRFAYKRLNGDGVITAKVHSIGNTAAWAKAGVMIRASLEPGSQYAFMLVTPDGRRAFQNRAVTEGTPRSAHSAIGAITLPFWVRVERKGNQFTAYYSQNGQNWVKQPDTENTGTDASLNPETINMMGSVYIGLAVTSNNTANACIAELSDVTTTGSVTGQWQVASIGGANPGNDPATLYVVLQDSSNNTRAVPNADPAFVNVTDWTEWQIPMSQFTGVSASRVKKMYIGVGNRNAATPGGTGMLYIDDIRVIKPAPAGQ